MSKSSKLRILTRLKPSSMHKLLEIKYIHYSSLRLLTL